MFLAKDSTWLWLEKGYRYELAECPLQPSGPSLKNPVGEKNNVPKACGPQGLCLTHCQRLLGGHLRQHAVAEVFATNCNGLLPIAISARFAKKAPHRSSQAVSTPPGHRLLRNPWWPLSSTTPQPVQEGALTGHTWQLEAITGRSLWEGKNRGALYNKEVLKNDKTEASKTFANVNVVSNSCNHSQSPVKPHGSVSQEAQLVLWP